QGVRHLGEGLDDRVELRGTDANAPAVERRVRATADHAAAALGDRDPVPVAPYAGVVCEVGGAISPSVGIVPEAGWHRRHGGCDDQLALLANHGVPGRVERLDPAAEMPAADLSLPDGNERAGAHEGGADIGAAGDTGKLQVRPNRLVDVAEPFSGQRGARRADAAQPGQVELVAGAMPAFRQAIRNGALVPKQVVPVSEASRHRCIRSGWAGVPSYST